MNFRTGPTRGVVLLTMVSLIFSLTGAAFAQGEGADRERMPGPADNSDLILKAIEEGRIPIIVRLRLPAGAYQPEGTLASSAAIDQQRSDIAAAREALLRSLAGFDAEAHSVYETLPFVGMRVDAAALEFLATSPHVATIQEDRLSKPYLESAGRHTGAAATWAAGFGGLGQTVVIVDSGIDADHPFFGGRVVDEACFSAHAGGISLCPNGTNMQIGPGAASVLIPVCWDGTRNICDHGTYVTGAAAGRDVGAVECMGCNGVAPEANIIAIQVLTRFDDPAICDPAPPPCFSSYGTDQLHALEHVYNHLQAIWDIAAVNMSIGGGQNTGACDGDPLKIPIDNLLSNGTATVIASGNDGFTDALGAPSCITTAVAVASVDDPDDNVFGNMHNLVDLLAVGEAVTSSIPDDIWTESGGTSIAAPQVAGAFAVIRAIDPGMSTDDILNLLMTTGVLVTDTRPPHPAGAVSGHVTPRLQLDAAVATLLETDLWVFKDCKPDAPMRAGETATCFITVENLGPDPALSVTLVDEHFSNGIFEFGAVNTDSGTCTTTPGPQGPTGTVTCDLGAILPGELIDIQVKVTADDGQDINDRVTAFSLSPDPDPDNNVAEDGVSVIASADLALVKTGTPDSVIAGTLLTYTLEVTNQGPSEAVNVVITDVLPAGVTIDSAAASAGACNPGVPGEASQPTTCTFDSLDAGAMETMTVVVTVLPDTTGILHNNARVSSDVGDPNNANDFASSDTNVTAEADLSIVKVDNPDPATAGMGITYTVTLSNNGPSFSRDIMLIDTLPSDVSFESATISNHPGTCVELEGTNTVECNLGDLWPGGSIDIYIDGLVDPSVQDGSTIQNTAAASSATPDPDPGNDGATEPTTVLAVADMAVDKFANLVASVPSETLVYTVDVVNLGPSDALNVQLVDPLPMTNKKVTYIFDSSNGACSYDLASHTLSCGYGTMPAGTSIPLDIHVKVKGSQGPITNTADVSSTTADPDAANNSATNVISIKGGSGKPK